MKKDTKIREVINLGLDHVVVSEQRHNQMLTAIVEGGNEKMRRKFSVGFALVMALIMLSVTALAATLINSVFEKVIDMEVANGQFVTWSFSEKLQLIELLSENGWEFPDNKLRDLMDTSLSDENREEIANAIITEAFGREDAISHFTIIESVKGPMTTWSLEDKAWYTSYIRSKIDVIDKWQDVLPEENDLTVEQAVGIAKAAVLSAYGMEQRELTSLIQCVSFFTNGEGTEPRWHISWMSDPYGAAEYQVLLTREGEIVEDTALEIFTPIHAAAMRNESADLEVSEQSDKPTGRSEFWSLEDKAQYIGDENGLPSASDISEEQAVSIAKDAIICLGVDINQYQMSVWYKLYDPYARESAGDQAPFYVIYFYDDVDAPYDVYSVVIDAQSGSILKEYTPHNGSNG